MKLLKTSSASHKTTSSISSHLREVDERWLYEALKLAKEAHCLGEVPVGSLIVDEAGVRIAEAMNQTRGSWDPTAHAEIVAIRKATQRSRRRFLEGSTLYVTLQPCWMCLAALLHAKIHRIVYLLPSSKIWPTLPKGVTEALWSSFFQPLSDPLRMGQCGPITWESKSTDHPLSVQSHRLLKDCFQRLREEKSCKRSAL